MGRLDQDFFARYTPTVAKSLLGMVVVRVIDGSRLSGRIVETEAYRAQRDPASHAYRGETGRNRVMFGEPGHAYVYFVYGNHHALNITTEPVGTAGAVLIRAIEPLEGVAKMKELRGRCDIDSLTDGPGKLTRAMQIGRELNGEDIVESKALFIENGTRPVEIGTSARVGISRGKTLRWRFFDAGSPFVSKAKPS